MVREGRRGCHDDKYNTYFTRRHFTTANETRWGGAVGTGVEIGFAPNWAVAFEYDHLFMGTHNVTFLPGDRRRAPDNIRQDVEWERCA